MGKLFIKLWILMVLTSVSSYKIQQTVFDNVYSEAMLTNSNERFRRVFVYIEGALMPFPRRNGRSASANCRNALVRLRNSWAPHAC